MAAQTNLQKDILVLNMEEQLAEVAGVRNMSLSLRKVMIPYFSADAVSENSIR